MAIERRLGILAHLSLFYNGVILLGVAMNYDWVRTRAAGGQFEEFPTSIRILYFFMASAMISLIFFLHDLLNSPPTKKRTRAARYLAYLFTLSTFMQLISRSADERFNAVPASIIAYTFFQLSKAREES